MKSPAIRTKLCLGETKCKYQPLQFADIAIQVKLEPEVGYNCIASKKVATVIFIYFSPGRLITKKLLCRGKTALINLNVKRIIRTYVGMNFALLIFEQCYYYYYY